MTEVLLVSLGSTGGLREADDAFADQLRRAGVDVATVRAAKPREVRTLALTDFMWAVSARRAALAGIRRHDPAVIIYSSVGAALLWPRSGAIRFDAPAAANRPGRHGIWQRAVERRRLRQAPLLLPWSAAGLAEAPRVDTQAIVVPVPVVAPSPAGRRDVDAVTYGANARKKGLGRVLKAWRLARRPDEELLVTGINGKAEFTVRYTGRLPPDEHRALLARSRVFVTAPRREDYGLVQLEALAAGCVLVTAPAPGPYIALELARALDPRTVDDDLVEAIRHGLDDPAPGYAENARALLAPYAPAAVDATVRDEVIPALRAMRAGARRSRTR